MGIDPPPKAKTASVSKAKCPPVPKDESKHPERLVLLPYCETGHGIEVGCGHRKTHDNVIGVDILNAGEIGKIGCVKGQVIMADITTSGDDLHMFKDEELDFVIARHNLEHYVDVIKTMQEWKRVLKDGGHMALVLPDERFIRTIPLDSTHYHAFTPESIHRYFELLTGFNKIKAETVLQNWSFVVVYKRNFALDK